MKKIEHVNSNKLIEGNILRKRLFCESELLPEKDPLFTDKENSKNVKFEQNIVV